MSVADIARSSRWTNTEGGLPLSAGILGCTAPLLAKFANITIVSATLTHMPRYWASLKTVLTDDGAENGSYILTGRLITSLYNEA